MDITWLGLSCFRLKGSQAVIITDPFPPDSGYSFGKQTANIVTVSHRHPSHSYTEGINGEFRLVERPGEYEISGVLIIGIGTYHDKLKGQSKGKNTAFLMEIDGVSVCHLGDIGHVPGDEQIEEMGDVDLLLLPVGGVSTLNASMAAEVIRKIEPKAVIPMHFKTPETSRELEPVDNFLREIGLGQIEPRPRLSISRSNLPTATQVFLLTPAGK